MMKTKKWVMPLWMEPYRETLQTCGHKAEDLFNGKTVVDINAPLALIEMGLQAQVELLSRLHAKGILK